MRLFVYLFMAAALLNGCTAPTETKTDTSGYQREVTEAVELLRQQLVDPEEDVLQKISADILTYGHSNGHVEDKAEFIESLISGKFNFETLELSEQTIDISGETAIVRHHLTGNTRDAGKDPGTANLKVLQVWQKQGDDWKLAARQAVRIIPVP